MLAEVTCTAENIGIFLIRGVYRNKLHLQLTIRAMRPNAYKIVTTLNTITTVKHKKHEKHFMSFTCNFHNVKSSCWTYCCLGVSHRRGTLTTLICFFSR